MAEPKTDLECGIAQLKARLPDYHLLSDYYRGRQKLTFASEKFRNAFGRLFLAFADNMCALVVDTLADRLQIVGFQLQDDSAGSVEEADILDLWEDDDMELLSGQIHLEAFKEGDAYVLVWPDPVTQDPVFYPQKAHTMTVMYN